MDIIHIFLHLDQTLVTLSQSFGIWLYVLLFLVVFAETGLVITPFLPGDSLLFAVGALTALPESGISLPLIIPLLIAAALIGDNTNYWIGRKFGPRVFSKEHSRFFNRKHLDKTQNFYDKFGTRAVFFGRFMPIARTFVPFVAGIGQMIYKKFIGYSIASALVWVCSFSLAGYYFGNLPSVKSHFHWVVVGVIVISLLPIAIEAIKTRRAS